MKDDEIHTHDLLNAHTGRIEWAELARYFARGLVVCVDPGEDLLAIARKMVGEHTKDVTFDNKLRTLLLSHDWPENMVELRSVVLRAVTLAQPMAPQVRHFQAAMNPDQQESAATAAVRPGAEAAAEVEG